MTDDSTPEPDSRLETDLLVIGGGMAGMTAAGHAAQLGLNVIVVERADALGGSALLSAGGVWSATSPAAFARLNIGGDQLVTNTMIERFESSVEWIRSLDVHIDPPTDMSDFMGFPARGYVVDILSFIRQCASHVRAAGGWIVTGATTRRLLVADASVIGAEVQDRDGVTAILARSTLLATGGFPASPALQEEFLGATSGRLTPRANPCSDGGGLRLAGAAGAALRGAGQKFYGHLIAWPLREPMRPQDYVPLAQMYSPWALLVDGEGRRFVDETLSYHNNANAVARLVTGRALLIGDRRVRAFDTARPAPSGQIDRFEVAVKAGARAFEAADLDEIDQTAATWGYRGVGTAVRAFNATVKTAVAIDPPRWRNRDPLDSPPWFIMETSPAITSTWQGVAVNERAQVLDGTGTPIAGLLAAGSDVGDVYVSAYAGGLSMAVTTGLIGAETARER